MNIDDFTDNISSFFSHIEETQREMLYKKKMIEEAKEIFKKDQEFEERNKYLFDQAAMFVIPKTDTLQLEEQRETNRLQRESLYALQAIEQNTANLSTIVELINKNNEQQDELITIISEILSIAKSKTEKEADSNFRRIMDKITQTINDGETLAKLAGFATTVYNLAKPIIDKLNI